MRKKITLNATEKSTEGHTIESAFKIFNTIKKANNLSPESLKYYSNCLSFFIKFVGDNTALEDIDEETVYDYIDTLQGGELTTSTINSYLRGLRTILYFFMDKGYMEPFKFQLLKQEQTIKEVYTSEEIDSLIKKPDLKKATFAEYRNYVLVCHFLSTGTRIRTTLNIRLKHVDLANGLITLAVTKNKKAYIIPISSTYLPILTEFIDIRKGEPDDFLFCTVYGEQLSKSTLQKEIKAYNLSRGVTKSSIHLFRHTFATNWILNGGDIKRLQAILGHSTIEMVMKYVNLYGVDLKENFDKYNVFDMHRDTVEAKKKLKLQL